MKPPTEQEIVAARERLQPYLDGYPEPMIDTRRLRIANGTATDDDRRQVQAEDWVIREQRGWENPDRDAARLKAARAAAGEAVLRAVASHVNEPQESTRSAWVLVNTFGFNDFPPEVKAWDQSVGPHVFYPAPVLAAFALNRPLPEKPDNPPVV